jgi:hypothetical protein
LTFDFLILEGEIDAWCRQKGNLLAVLLALGDHKIDGGLAVPVLIHLSLLLVLHKKGVQ